MGVQRGKVSTRHALPFKSANKDRRKDFHIKQKKTKDALKRQERFKRRKEEDRNPRLREERLARNVPHTIDSKRQWDEVEGEDGADMLGLAVDLERLNKRRKLEEAEAENSEAGDDNEAEDEEDEEDEEETGEGVASKKTRKARARADDDSDVDSMLDFDSESETEKPAKTQQRAPSPNPSTASTRLDLTPEALASRFPTLFGAPRDPKVLITTSINSTLHEQADMLTGMFPNSKYVRRSAHRFGHKYSVREIASFASNRDYTTLIVLNEDQKRPCGIDIVHLPEGPMFHFSISNWIEGKKLPGHGNATNHYPELILNNFRTPLGMLTAHLFRTLFPPAPELEGRQVVTLHNQRDYIFFRRHRYVFRDKRATEKSVVGPDGKPIEGVEDIRAGLQELGPRFTMKLRRVDTGIQRRSGQEWEWKGKTDRIRTKFQL
ncbi:Brix-domain-containing protein [Trichodelitschia bisporula]|uniref:Brix-domain-containing protein n=1 Tax=Trichodelitschia bisporula TaxID=703511 RepID=A0A6G1I863_9PEZI|nr:Brix-domain-containing protein [Trichodelitschia bisporula]